MGLPLPLLPGRVNPPAILLNIFPTKAFLASSKSRQGPEGPQTSRLLALPLASTHRLGGEGLCPPEASHHLVLLWTPYAQR
jgi:hypothetical protein